MSKAFTRESDDEREFAAFAQAQPLPPGAKNYVTPEGARSLRQELERLVEVERPRIAGLPDKGEQARRLQLLDHRISYVEQSLKTAVVVELPAPPWETVRFGATVKVRESGGVEAQYRIVGVDEADFDRGWISWCSPLARALINARKGQRVRFRAPDGDQEFELIDISYSA